MRLRVTRSSHTPVGSAHSSTRPIHPNTSHTAIFAESRAVAHPAQIHCFAPFSQSSALHFHDTCSTEWLTGMTSVNGANDGDEVTLGSCLVLEELGARKIEPSPPTSEGHNSTRRSVKEVLRGSHPQTWAVYPPPACDGMRGSVRLHQSSGRSRS